MRSRGATVNPESGERAAEAVALFGRPGVGVGFDFVALFLDHAPQLALHGFKSVVDDFRQWRVGTVVHSLFIGD